LEQVVFVGFQISEVGERVTEGEVTDPEVRILAELSQTLRTEYAEDELAWEGSPFQWIKTRPSRQVGTIGEKLVAGWCAANDFDVTKPPNSDADRVIDGLLTEIKFSTLWAAGGYKFQQIRDQDYEIVICLGVSPFDAHCWVLPKSVLLEHVIGHTPQHGGQRGSDTAWIHVDPNDVHPWTAPWGGSLAEAREVLQGLTRRGV
jgi:hypothetical protein